MEKYVVVINAEQIDDFREYLYERENADATVSKYIADIRTFWRYLDGDYIIDKKRVIAYKEWLLRRYAVSSVNSMLAALNQFFEFLECDGLKVRRVRTQKSLFLSAEKELTREEYQRLLQAAVDGGKYQLALCMETIASTGIRISELSYFTVEAVKQDHIEIFNKGKYRRIFIPRTLRKKLLAYAEERGIRQGPIFVTRTGRPKSRSNIWREMKALKEKAGIAGSKIFPHNLRHLFARIYYKATKDLAGLGDLLGHSSLNVTRIYTSTTGEMYQRQLDIMKKLIPAPRLST